MTVIKYLDDAPTYYRTYFEIKRVATPLGWKDKQIYAATDHEDVIRARPLPYQPAYVLTNDREVQRKVADFMATHPDKIDLESESPNFIRFSIDKEFLAQVIGDELNETGKDITRICDRTGQTEHRQEGLPA